MADWLTHQARLAKRRLDLFAVAERLANLPLDKEGGMSTILTDDDKAEIYSLVMANPTQGTDGVLLRDVADRIEMILRDKLMEVLPIIQSERQNNPMNGDGGNYRLERVREKIIEHFGL